MLWTSSGLELQLPDQQATDLGRHLRVDLEILSARGPISGILLLLAGGYLVYYWLSLWPLLRCTS